MKKLELAAAANTKDSKRSKQIASKKKKMLRVGVEKMGKFTIVSAVAGAVPSLFAVPLFLHCLWAEDGRKFTIHRMQIRLGGFHGMRDGSINGNENGWRKKRRQVRHNALILFSRRS